MAHLLARGEGVSLPDGELLAFLRMWSEDRVTEHRDYDLVAMLGAIFAIVAYPSELSSRSLCHPPCWSAASNSRSQPMAPPLHPGQAVPQIRRLGAPLASRVFQCDYRSAWRGSVLSAAGGG